MRIYSLTQSNYYTIPDNVLEAIYVESIPYSLQMQLNIARNIVVQKGNLIKVSGRVIEGKRAQKIIKVLNGYSKCNRKVEYHR